MTPQETDSDLPVSVQDLQQRHGLAVACCRVGGTECSNACMGPFEEGHHYLHYLHHSLASGERTGREHSPAHQQKIGLKIYWAWPRPSEKDPVSPSVSLCHQETSMSLLSLSIRGRQNENHNHIKLTYLIPWTTALSNSMKQLSKHTKEEGCEDAGIRWPSYKSRREARNRCLPHTLRRNHRCWHFDPRVLASKTVRPNISVV